MGTNGSTLQVNSGYTINDGNSGNNYSVSTSTATGTISKAALTVTANADAKFVTQTDATGYNGVRYSGWVNGEESTVLGGTLSISRTNASTNVGAGTYAGTLVASGLTSGNYTISYANGDYTIVPANQLLIRTNNVSTVYGTGPTYSTTAQYLDGNTNLIQTLTQSNTGNSITFSDGAGGSVTTVLKPYTVTSGTASAAGVSSSGNTVVGNFSILDINPSITGANFLGAPVYVGTLTVTPKALTAAMASNNKVYDGTVTASVTGSSADIITGDKISFANTSATFDTKNVGTGKAVSVSGIAISGTDAGNYALQNTTASTTADVLKKDASITGTTTNLTYNGAVQTQDAAVLSGFVASDVSNGTVAVTGLATGRNAGTYTSNLLATGTDAGNYNVTVTNADLVVGKKSLVLSAGNDSKTYDGTTNSSGTVTAAALQGADTITASQLFASKDVMGTNGSTLQVNSGYTINDGNSGNNYSVSTSTATGTISKAALTVTANADAKFVTQTDATGYNGVRYSGWVNGEESTVLGGTLSISRTNASTNVGAGTYAGTLVASGLTSGNYTISYANGDYTIVPANQLLIRTTNVSTVYGTAPTYSTTAQYLDGNTNLIQTLTQSNTGNSVTFSDGAGGSVTTVLKPYSGAALATQSSTGNTVVGSYAIKDANAIVTGNNFVGAPVYVGTLTITPKEVSTSAAGVSKVYDGTTAMGNATLSLAGQLMGDQLGVSGTGAFSQKNVGTNLSYAFNNVALTGADRGNYYLSGGNSLTGTNGVITPATLTIVGTQAADKNYDGTTQASVTPGTVSGLVGSETLSIAKLDGQFDTPTPGKDKSVKVVYTLANGSNGGLASNYTWSPVFTTAQVFNPAKDQRYKPEVGAVADSYSRVSYLGFNAKTGAAVAGTSRAPWQANNSACTASRLEECICEQAEDPSVEICVAPTRAQAE